MFNILKYLCGFLLMSLVLSHTVLPEYLRQNSHCELEYPGGYNQLLSDLLEELSSNDDVRNGAERGQVVLRFLIDTSGRAIDCEVLKVTEGFEIEIVNAENAVLKLPHNFTHQKSDSDHSSCPIIIPFTFFQQTEEISAGADFNPLEGMKSKLGPQTSHNENNLHTQSAGWPMSTQSVDSNCASYSQQSKQFFFSLLCGISITYASSY